MRITLVKSIFCPSQSFFDDMTQSLIKTSIYLQLNYSDNIYDLLLIGWANNFQKNIDLFLKLGSLCFSRTRVIYFDDNYGKAYLINVLIDETLKKNINADYIIYMDHDVWFNFDDIGSITDVITPYLFSQYINSKKLGIIFYNQLQDVRHQLTIYENKIIFSDVTLCWTDDIYAYASGAFVIPTNILANMKKISINRVYGFDDYQITHNILQQNYSVAVAQDYYIIHPNTKLRNIKYQIWKIDMIISDNELDYTLSDLWIFHDKLIKIHQELRNIYHQSNHNMF